ncbi:MAG: NADH-quinone oxidoreductase subunit L [Ketobacteraceae bacterium]|nr:NADH-quinone oxidoreductase subunit L [Ketobacteraceae bacterium]
MSELFSGWLLPVIYTLGFLLAFSQKAYHWPIARISALTALAVTLAAAAGALLWSQFQVLQFDKLGITLALLVSLLGWVIINYSFRYLAGEPGQARFVRSMLFTLACVSVLVVSNHLVVIVLAWSGTSIGLHYLLTFYRERKAAQIVAHKKFIVSRLADLCLLVALVLIYNATGSLTLPDISAQLQGMDSLPSALHWATVLFALAAILKSAQLPLHGWLIQVMEAPTPVSALLHAGVVNIGGFVLIRLAELVALAPAAQILLVVVGSLTAVLAGLVMMTRISIKVRLAWSTCAQMGFMLMEVGLGLYELALLHLVAHSLYKAYAFLSAGDRVAEARQNDFAPQGKQDHSLLRYLGSFAVTSVAVAGSVALWQALIPSLQVPLAAAVIVALGLAPLLWLERGPAPGLAIRGLLQTLALTQLYLVWHVLFAGLAPAASDSASWLVGWTMLCFTLLYAAQIWLRRHPHGRFARQMYPWAYCGFYLDETFTRLTFKFWPARLSPVQARTLVNRHPADLGDLV